MATFCASSAKLALPTVLRNAFRSEFASEFHSFRDTRSLVSLRRAPHYRRGYNGRNFSSISPLRLSQPGSHVTSQSTTTESISTQLHDETSQSSEVLAETTADNRHQRKTNSSTTQVNPDTASAKATRDKKHARNDRPFQKPGPKKKKEHWQIQKAALKSKFKEGWNPSKKLSPDALDGIRHLHAVAPDKFTTPILAEQFQISPEAIRRILKSKWRPSETEMEDRRKRWDKRHDRIWSHMSELGLRPRTKRTEAFADANILYGNKGDKDSKP
ncbi:Required for respiratory growth protein 9 mitochondrial [Aspergillus hancockii]|nr:Required for respiratory growth protein 9 mitochondrial [Aspergillus hancockii]